MLRYALRRVLWLFPTLLVTSLVLFFVTTLVPEPTAAALPEGVSAGAPNADDSGIYEARRTRFLDLPRFFNADPSDVRRRAHDALARAAAGETDGAELCRLGGAGLPYVLPELESLTPGARGRVAQALAPLARRMDLPGLADLERPDTAVLFWTHLWENRALDFTRAAVARAVARLVEHGSEAREHELATMDTFALPEILGAMATARDPLTLARLTRLARHATRRGHVVVAGASNDELRRAVADWKEWWFVHASDFVAFEGWTRALSFLTETRYGKWLERAAGGELGVSAVDGEPIADKLRARAPVTLLVCGLALLSSWVVAVPVGAVAAWRQGRRFDVVTFAALFVLYAAPTFAIAELLRRVAADRAVTATDGTLAATALALGSIAALARWQRAAMLEVMRQDFVRTARAKGVPELRVAVVHALRNALQPVLVLAGLHLPALFGGALVVEEVFGLPGVGYETLRAIERHDVPWLMAVLVFAALATSIGMALSDVCAGALDPRVREVLAARLGAEAP